MNVDLTAHRLALQQQGFTLLDVEGAALVAVRIRTSLDCMRVSTIIRVRQLDTLDVDTARGAQKTMRALGSRLNPSVVPRGFMQTWVLIDCFMVDRADEAALSWARRTVGKGMGLVYHPLVLTPEGATHCEAPRWGRMFWPRIKHDLDLLTDPANAPTHPPRSTMGTVLVVLYAGPFLLLLILSCCGLPLLAVPVVQSLERKKLLALKER